MKPNWQLWIVGIAAAIPVGLLLLAQLFHSDLLGWMFGLSLMAGVALFAAGVVWVIVLLLASPFRRPRADAPGLAASTALSTGSTKLTITIDRDSVHAGDDGQPHTQTITVDAALHLSNLLQRLQRSGYFPSISGGEATWIIESSGRPSAPIGVHAQQWAEARWLEAADDSLASHFHAASPALHFRYWCQVDPQLVFSQMASGRPLPPRYRTA